MQKQKNQLLLLADVDGLGRSGDVVSAKPGFIRNFLLPKKKAVIASKHTLQMQEKLQKERVKQAGIDRKDAEALAKILEDKLFEVEVKVDPDGHMYGSIAANDLVKIFEDEGLSVERKNFILLHPIKQIGEHSIPMRLKEGVGATCRLQINSDIAIMPTIAVEKPAQNESEAENLGE
jgi:large subunit ribosomal protein L9